MGFPRLGRRSTSVFIGRAGALGPAEGRLLGGRSDDFVRSLLLASAGFSSSASSSQLSSTSIVLLGGGGRSVIVGSAGIVGSTGIGGRSVIVGSTGIGGSVRDAPGSRGGFLRDEGGALGSGRGVGSSESSHAICTSIVGRSGGRIDAGLFALSSGSVSSQATGTSIVVRRGGAFELRFCGGFEPVALDADGGLEERLEIRPGGLLLATTRRYLGRRPSHRCRSVRPPRMAGPALSWCEPVRRRPSSRATPRSRS